MDEEGALMEELGLGFLRRFSSSGEAKGERGDDVRRGETWRGGSIYRADVDPNMAVPGHGPPRQLEKYQ